MQRALALAKATSGLGNVPVGALVVVDDEIVGEAANLRHTLQDPTAHAEILALRAAAQRLGTWRLDDATLYVTLEPCAMCTGAIDQARVRLVVVGAKDPRKGHSTVSTDRVEGVLQEECEAVLTSFFAELRSTASGD
jgi:tRNA(adenine34) deaminase